MGKLSISANTNSYPTKKCTTIIRIVVGFAMTVGHAGEAHKQCVQTMFVTRGEINRLYFSSSKLPPHGNHFGWKSKHIPFSTVTTAPHGSNSPKTISISRLMQQGRAGRFAREKPREDLVFIPCKSFDGTFCSIRSQIRSSPQDAHPVRTGM